MGFRGQDFAFDSPAAAVAGLVARLAGAGAARPPEAVALDAARGRVLAEDVRADRDSPAFNYSAMDGYAVRAADVEAVIRRADEGASVTLAVVGESRIGAAPPVLPGEPHGAGMSAAPAGEGGRAIRIVTGAATPEGADAVLRREDVVEHGAGLAADDECITSISLAPNVATRGGVRVGDNIRRRGENARAEETVLTAGTVLTAAALGTLAAVGCVWPRVHPRVRVAVITTGDELVSPQATPGPYQIRNSNAAVIRAVLGSHAWIELVTRPDGTVMHAGDEEGALDAVLKAAIGHADAVVLTGGVSMGHRDPVRAAVERCAAVAAEGGAEIVFHGLPQRPGKPMLGAVVRRVGGASADERVPVFGLPGNPISAMVTCTRIVLPVLASLAAASADRAPVVGVPRLVTLANPDGKTLDLWWHRLVRINAVGGAGMAELVDGRGSGDIIAGGRSDGFIEVPPTTASHCTASARATPALVPFYPWPT
ncbi:MAG: molybdopterin molybdotransferase MoeA [Gemmatimonadales bacterium]|nr:molybdopterin molybdotransferase MoeA [Gemmatimonadales bacterium]